jgi:hypothetical protein
MLVMDQTNFSYLSNDELECFIEAIAVYLRAPESRGWFYNADKGHPSYRHLDGVPMERPVSADGPETNRIFQIGHGLSLEIKSRGERFKGPKAPTMFTDWPSFCVAVSEIYDSQRPA